MGEHYIVKWGKYVRLREGENMLFIRQTSGVPVPTVYALFEDEETGLKFIVQEYIPGKTLGSAWKSLDTSDKVAITSQLRQHMDELRSIPSPGYYGGIWRQPIADLTFMDREEIGPHSDQAISGPQESEEQRVNAMWQSLDARMRSVERLGLPVLRHIYHVIFRGLKSVFTHGDFHRGNIVLRDDKTVVIIDWESSG